MRPPRAVPSMVPSSLGWELSGVGEGKGGRASHDTFVSCATETGVDTYISYLLFAGSRCRTEISLSLPSLLIPSR
jgi:hypothetical protein